MSHAPMGIMNQMWAATGVGDEDAIRVSLEEIELADELGFDSIWIGEHHGTRPGGPFYGRIPAPELMMAYIAGRCRRITVGSGVRILSSAPAARSIEEMSLLHILTGGRVEYGIGLGSFQPNMVESRELKAARFQATLGEMLGFLDGQPLVEGVALTPTPSLEIRGKIWAAARDPSTLRYLAARGVNLVVGQAELPRIQQDHVRRYREAGGTGTTRGVRLVFVAESHDEAIAETEAAARIYFDMMGGKGYHKEAVDAGLLPPTVDSPEEMRAQVNFIVGDPDEVAAALASYVEVTGVDRLDVMLQIPGLETAAVRRSMTLMQREVRGRLALASST